MVEEVSTTPEVEVTSAPQEVAKTKKKKSPVLAIILLVLLVICGGITYGGYVLYKKGQAAVNDFQVQLDETVGSFDEIQKEIQEVTDQAVNGEITEEEAILRIEELKLKSLELMQFGE